MNNIIWHIIIVIVIGGLFIASNTITARWAKTNQHWLWVLVFLFAIIGYVLFGVLIKKTNLSTSAGLVDSIIVIGSIFIGIFVLNDTVTAKQAAGLLLACLAVVLLI